MAERMASSAPRLLTVLAISLMMFPHTASLGLEPPGGGGGLMRSVGPLPADVAYVHHWSDGFLAVTEDGSIYLLSRSLSTVHRARVPKPFAAPPEIEPSPSGDVLALYDYRLVVMSPYGMEMWNRTFPCEVRDVAWDEGATRLAVLLSDGSLEVWDVGSRTLAGRFRAEGYEEVSFQGGGSLILTGDSGAERIGPDGTVEWAIDSPVSLAASGPHRTALLHDRQITMVDSVSGEVAGRLSLRAGVEGMDLGPNGELVAWGGNYLVIFTESGERVLESGMMRELRGGEIDPTGRMAAVMSGGRVVVYSTLGRASGVTSSPQGNRPGTWRGRGRAIASWWRAGGGSPSSTHPRAT